MPRINVHFLTPSPLNAQLSSSRRQIVILIFSLYHTSVGCASQTRKSSRPYLIKILFDIKNVHIQQFHWKLFVSFGCE